MQVTEFKIGVGQHSDLAQRVLYKAMEMQWKNEELFAYYHFVFSFLAAGANVEAAILEADTMIITEPFE